jgi:hypothetical protein
MVLNTLKAKLNPICHLLALLRAHPILHVKSLRVNTGEESALRTYMGSDLSVYLIQQMDWDLAGGSTILKPF